VKDPKSTVLARNTAASLLTNHISNRHEDVAPALLDANFRLRYIVDAAEKGDCEVGEAVDLNILSMEDFSDDKYEIPNYDDGSSVKQVNSCITSLQLN
jgi:hypothetical protein